MKVLFLSQGRQIADQIDFDVSLRRASSEGNPIEVLNIPYVGYVEKHGGEAFYNEVVRANNEFGPDLVFFQFFHSANPGDPRPCIETIRRCSRPPVIFGSLGDLFDAGTLKTLGRPIPKETIELASVADAFFSTSMGDIADELVRKGARNVMFLPHAFLPEHFKISEPEDYCEKDCDVIMIGSRARVMTRRIITGLSRGLTRNFTVALLKRHFGNRFAVYGHGWNGVGARGVCKFTEQINMFRHARVAVDAPMQINSHYYMSDRPFFILGSGTPLVMKHMPGIDTVFKENENAFFANSIFDIPMICNEILSKTSEELHDIGSRNIALVRSRHMISNRIDTLISVYETLKSVRSGRMDKGTGFHNLRMWHFLAEVDVEKEFEHCVANWVG